ncbi:MAG: CUB domain-containing protein [Flavobacteriales bacterium]|nr:CUB domain-containing protein [Flavobacteriales bacterium]
MAPDPAQGLFSICVDRTDPVLCAGTYYDSGGPSANYMDNENIDIDAQSLFCPHKAGDVVTLTFLQFNIEAGWDFMRIYNGQSTAAPLIGTYTGTSSPGTITANLTGNPSGCLYVVFTSDFIITAPAMPSR